MNPERIPLYGICLDVSPARIFDEINGKRKLLLETENTKKLRKILSEGRVSLHEILDDLNEELEQNLKAYRPQFLIELGVYNRYKWDRGKSISVGFLDDPLALRETVLKHAAEWSACCNISFKYEPIPSKAEIRISFKSPGAWSYIGTHCLQVPVTESTMNFGFFDHTTPPFEIRRTVLHEFGHALGFIHEHQAPSAKINWNKELIYREYGSPPNSWPRAKVDANLFDRYSSGEVTNSTFDKSSIMAYPIERRHTTNGFSIPWNNDLSPTDRQFAKTLYP
jgi:serralysin